jgi:S1-C subfamily serine protease
MEVSTFADQLFYTTAHIASESDDGRHWSGTGFVYQEEVEGGVAVFLVTNKHVLEGARRVRVRMAVRGADGAPVPERATEIAVHIDGPWWTGHPLPSVDVAVAPLVPVINRMTELGASPYYRAITSALIPNQEQLAQLDSIEPVMFAGYPAGLYDTFNSTPIVRQGVSASRLQLDYCGAPAFLIDASVFPGSSGSPVFLSVRALSANREGGIQLGGRTPWLLGVLAAVHQTQVEGSIVELPASFVARMPQLLNLGIVYKSSAIQECFRLALRTERGDDRPVAA